MTSDILNENQRRHYHILLSMLAQSAAKLEALAAARPSADTTFVSYTNDVPDDFLPRIEPHLRALRETLLRLASELRIEPKKISRRNSIRAILVTEIVRLEDSMARGLRGYGEVDSRVRDTLDPMLDALARELQAIRRILES
jgi:hypothetical protein